ncbi:MAG: Kelch repeat-containing protein [Candidatus Entotheonellia bacterium]
MRPIVRRAGRQYMLYHLVPMLLGSLWLVGWGVLVAEGAVFWTNVTPGGDKPDRRDGHGLAYDTARGKVVLFGGGTGWHSSPTLFQDTWEWDGAARTWTKVNLNGPRPPARWGAHLAYDTVQGRTVLFGGWVSENPRIYQDDTWVWDGVTWTEVNLSGPRPAARYGHAVAYDAAHDTAVLFGGLPAGTEDSFQDTWIYDDDNSVRQGYWTINECRGAGNTNSEPCYWHYRYDRSRCTPGQPCGKLVVFFSTGLQTCDEPQTFATDQGKGKILQAYAVDDPTPGDGYVAVCANTFLTAIGPESVPYNDEAERVDELMRNITHTSSPQSSVIRAVWDGRHLLWSGVSHGASAPVIAMARTTFDSDPQRPWWKGSAFTAACFYDGVYNAIDLDLFWALHGCTRPLHDLHARGIEQRYYGEDAAFDHSCVQGQCPCAPVSAQRSPEIDEDTITGNLRTGEGPVLPGEYAIRDWKLIECGSNLSPCIEDRLPKKTIQDLCDQLNTDPLEPDRCAWDPLPDKSHNACADSDEGIPKCRDWFTTKVGP